jgi:hypothetical protein
MRKDDQEGVPEESGQNTLIDTVNATFNSMVEDVKNIINDNDERASRE